MTDEGLKLEILSRIAQTIGALSKLKTIILIREHRPQLQNQNDAFLDHFNLPVPVWNMGPYSRVGEKDSSLHP